MYLFSTRWGVFEPMWGALWFRGAYREAELAKAQAHARRVGGVIVDLWSPPAQPEAVSA